MTDQPTGLAGRTVLIAGATSASGRAVARALLDAGARVVAVGSDDGRLEALEAELPGVIGERADLTDGDDVLELAMRVHARVGDLDGVVHLVGGWRGGGGIAGQTEEDYRVLERSFTALRYVSRAFWDDLVASPAGRIAIVSSTTVDRPTAGGANYTAIKAASESWMRSLAQGFAKAGDTAAAVTFRVQALAGLEDRLAAEVVELWAADAAELNGRVETLSA
ncbi:NAD(P)-dependent dehydrogenase (short-subunit alcohol dehydrogenase family) [Agromyces hippuratus]|uniref:NAD(P)-dependent dehydrogenase (Short-subunit alcohol dehydrogenase family) n=1 Tax=Agromyces hippuratus TaxID=286438 RepID=A0A852WU43_9MICO|nr:SDR family NAD(P)-dependent oxidoreductase [Agromyces hippuratus]NYG21526.1 NAD(P)-dependent dehydrogenase (short-subunit alcohol dehydrogenase family) [Agromyces hippuratus]